MLMLRYTVHSYVLFRRTIATLRSSSDSDMCWGCMNPVLYCTCKDKSR